MIRRQIFAALSFVAITSGPLLATEFACWDGTFGYNAAHLVETANRIELTLTGSQLGPLKLSSQAERIELNDWSNQTIYIPFRKQDCVFAADQKSGSCDTKILANKWESAFITRNVSDLGESRVALQSPFYSERIKMDFVLGESINVHFIRSGFSDSPDEQVSKVQLKYCGDEMHQGNIIGTFPQRLTDYLDAPRH